MNNKPKNERNAGKPPKYKEGVETCKIHPLIPKQVRKQCLEAVEKIVEPFKN